MLVRRCLRFLPKPLQSPRVPIWIGGYWPNRRPFRRAARWDGQYPGTEKANGESLTLEDFKEVAAYVQVHRQTSTPFDIAVAGVTPPNPVKGAEIVRPYIETGATWWVEVNNDSTGSFDEMKERIRNGPPKVQAA